ncbi:hypothetical protein BALCAV_0222535 [Alkalihalobacillus alcalophilus ATCC 27647 = CGMCC 1.3604]|uniref:Uncharacterized protein n=1 Tax=Alkalihalobacillus alcalophilus ATCC 27647 = CGMCC 1.3604 TaxID=1218173 RepID=A0A094X9L6_ALKAL|nr:hypothetical protein BALCAV_0222535 [Alkalihalobacillus alcalophilus ATCC 27647 = CGMCC 1.3604]
MKPIIEIHHESTKSRVQDESVVFVPPREKHRGKSDMPHLPEEENRRGSRTLPSDKAHSNRSVLFNLHKENAQAKKSSGP